MQPTAQAVLLDVEDNQAPDGAKEKSRESIRNHFLPESHPNTRLANSSENPKRALARE